MLAMLCSWQVFGVERPQQTIQSEAETSSAFRPVFVQGKKQNRQNSCGEVRPAPGQGQGVVKVNRPAQSGISLWM